MTAEINFDAYPPPGMASKGCSRFVSFDVSVIEWFTIKAS